MDQESDWLGNNQVHVALYHMAVSRIDLTIGLIDRLRKLFTDKLPMTFDTKETAIELNGVQLEAFPSHHLDAMRGLPNV